MSEDEPESRRRGILHPEGMQAARDLAAGVVHEVNNILGVIIGNVHLAKKSSSSSSAVEKYLSEARDAAEQGRELMRNLSILASGRSSLARVVSLNDLTRNAVSRFPKVAELDLSSEDPAIDVDICLAQDAISSVARFMSETAAVTVIRVITRVVGSAVALTFEDDGTSPSDKELRILFAPFTKVDRRPKSDLGLAKIADLAARSGGFVAAGVREPHGLRIVLTLPVAATGVSGDRPGVPLPKKGV